MFVSQAVPNGLNLIGSSGDMTLFQSDWFIMKVLIDDSLLA
jgi:hypothetical protein